ncbi:sensor histidine kinase [Azospirillum sp. sgz302134]
MPFRPYLPALLAALVGTGLTLLLADQERRHVEDVRRSEIATDADGVSTALQTSLVSRELVPTIFGGLFTPDQEVRRSDLAAVAERVFARTPSMVAVSWLPRTPPAQAGALLESLRQAGVTVPYFRGPNGTKIDPETVGRDLFPVQLIEPLAGNEMAVGIDVAAFPLRAQALANARDTGQTVATAPLRLVQAPDVLATILYTPVYRRLAPGATVEARRAALKGVITTVFRYDRLIPDGVAGQPHRFAHVHVFDAAAQAGQRHLHTLVAPGSSASDDREAEALLDDEGLIRRTVTWGGRAWTLVFEPLERPPAVLDPRVELAFALGLVLTTLIAGYLALQAHSTGLLQQEIQARRKAEAEKDLLMREVNHRVKNSLQLVGAMLGMQGRKATDDQVRRELDEAGARVRAIAQVHERLYRGESVTTVDVDAYLRTLCADLAASVPEYTIRVTATAIELPTDQVVPLGLMVVELVTNAIKHSNPANGHLCVEVGFGPVGDGELELTVRDHGVGMPDGFSIQKPGRSLGMTVVNSLARQISAELTVEDAAPGARWRVRF